MVNTSTKQLFDQLNAAEKGIRSKNISSDQRLALANYIGNLYCALICMGRSDISFNKNKVFGGKKNYSKFVKHINSYSDKLIKNYIDNKEFHKDYFYEIMPDVEEFNCMMMHTKNKEKYFSKKEFMDILFQFMKSINQDELFDKLCKNGDIYSSKMGNDIGNDGFTLYNPLNKQTDLFVKNLKYNLRAMNILVHEIGHAYDLSTLSGDVHEYNNYFYLSLYGEVMSRLFERLFLDFLRKKNIAYENVIEKQIDYNLLNHDFLLQAFILSLLDDDFILEDKYLNCDSDEIVDMIGSYFIDKKFIKNYIEGIISFDLSEIYNYAYGDIISLFLFDEVNKYGFDNEMIEYFLRNRCELFSEDFLRECGFGPVNYVKLYKKVNKHLIK